MNRILLGIVIGVFLQVAFTSRTKVQEKSKKFSEYLSRLEKDNGDKTKIVQTSGEKQSQAEANAKANELYAKSKDGTDQYDPSEIGFEMYIMVDNKQAMSILPSSASTNVPDYDKYIVRVNRYSLYYGDDVGGYRGIRNSLPLKLLRGSGENIAAGECCKAVSPVSLVEFHFILGKGHSSWNKYNESLLFHYKARGSIMMGIIKNYLWEIGHLGDMNLVSLMPAGMFDDWTWMTQDDWPGICRDGNAQSPINIEEGKTTLAPNMRLQWRLDSEDVPVANFNGHEMVVTGGFGSVVHQLEIGERTFRFDSMSFKFPSEHQFSGTSLDGEIVLNGKSKDGLKSIISFLIKEVVDGDADHNKFVENLDVEGWKFDVKQKYRLDGRPSLSDIVKGGAEIYYQKSFFWYMGSLSIPPCSQEVFRFVFKEAIMVPSVQFQAWKAASYSSDEETSGNGRRAKDMTGRLVYYHIDKSANCKLPADKIIEAANDEIATREANKPKEWRGKFLIANTTLNSYAATYDNDWVPIQNDWISVQPIEKYQVPKDAIDDLSNKEMARKKYWAESVMKERGLDMTKTKIVY